MQKGPRLCMRGDFGAAAPRGVDKLEKQYPYEMKPFSIAVIGAGLSGLMAAKTLQDRGHEVRVYEKSRGAGGRMATRREGELRFDHGAQYFTVRDDGFRNSVDSWREEGLVREWNGRIATVKPPGKVSVKESTVQRYVGVPGMNAVARRLADGLSVSFGTLVDGASYQNDRWILQDSDGAEISRSDVLVVSTPAPQAASLLEGQAAFSRALEEVRMLPCWAVLASFDAPVETEFDAAFFHNSPISWAARNSSKPGRPKAESWIIHATNSWSREHLEESPEALAEALLDVFLADTELPPAKAAFLKGHRWRYAIAEKPLSQGYLWDPEKMVGVCGDWCSGSRVEGAYLSGVAVAEAILREAVDT